MPIYEPPTRDYEFVLTELLRWRTINDLPGYAHATWDTVAAVLDEAGRFCTEVLLPLNRSGDEEGCQYENGVVRTPHGFKEAYQSFREAGWVGLACDEEDGGQGLPNTVLLCLDEMVASANMSFGNYPGLSRGAYKVIREHGTNELRRRFLPSMASGVWSGTMCLTEAHAGTDLGLMRTKAVSTGEGTYRITGSKIFITSGEHDLTDNIIHLVLARLPGAAPGIKGVSLFLVPKILVDGSGKLGTRNQVRCGSIEHKMGIRASVTCVMNFDGAEGYLIGEPGKGTRAMFTMMNMMRIVIGLQGLGIAEASYQTACRYAKDRLQSRSMSGVKHPDKPADPIIVHPDVRRMLLTMRAYVEGSRALALWTATQIDVAERHPDPEQREAAEDMRAFLTPVVKAFLSDSGFEAANLGVHVFGGHGFIREHGMEQFVRDAKITQLYEGTNGIQSLDLTARKTAMHGGRLVKRFSDQIGEYLGSQEISKAQGQIIPALARAFQDFRSATAFVQARAGSHPDDVGAAATDYLRLTALVALGYLWARSSEIAHPKASIDPFYRGKVQTAEFFASKILPQTQSLAASIMAGSGSVMAMVADEF